jgi:hypothetical protein
MPPAAPASPYTGVPLICYGSPCGAAAPPTGSCPGDLHREAVHHNVEHDARRQLIAGDDAASQRRAVVCKVLPATAAVAAGDAGVQAPCGSKHRRTVTFAAAMVPVQWQPTCG